VYDTFRSAIALATVSAVLENIGIRNVTAENTGKAIFLRQGHRALAVPLHIGNVQTELSPGKSNKGYEIEGPVYEEPHNTSITGWPSYLVQDVTLENIEPTYVGSNS
jgi:hypothetical protein